jgi:hypothetical protein
MINAADRRLILLLGSSRSGTTWLAALLNSHPEVVYSHEPLSRLHAPHIDGLIEKIKATGNLFDHERRRLMLEWSAANHECRRPPFFPKAFGWTPAWLSMLSWVAVRVSGRGEGAFRRIFSPSQRQPFDVLIKEIEWSKHAEMLVQALDPTLLIIMRHPCGMAASVLRGQRLGLMPNHDRMVWYFDHVEICQEVGYDAGDIPKLATGEFIGLQWLVHNLLYRKAMQAHPDSKLVVFEDLCRNPARVTRDVFVFLGWQLGPRTLRFIENSTKERRIRLLDWLQAKHPYFGVKKDSIQSAESWRSELSHEQKQQVLSIASRLPDFEGYWPDSGMASVSVNTGGSVPSLSGDRQHEKNGSTTALRTSPEAPAKLSIPLTLENLANVHDSQPATLGLPFPRGALPRTSFLRLTDSDGGPVSLQARALNHWPDGSVRWALLDFLIPATRKAKDVWRLDILLQPEMPLSTAALDIQRSADSIIVNTGTATFHIGRGNIPLLQAAVRGKDLLTPNSARILLTDAKGRRAAFAAERLVLENRGPIRAHVLLDGLMRDSPLRLAIRLCFSAGTSQVGFNVTLHNPRRARHRQGLWDLGDPGSILFKELALELEVAGSADRFIHWSAEADIPLETTSEKKLEIYQDSSGGENWHCKNHVNRDGIVPTSFRGYRVTLGRQEYLGLRASPVVTLQGANGAISLALPEFWQQFPRALAIDDRLLRVGLFPGQFSDLFELQGGEQKTHALWLDFAPRDQACPDPLRWVHQPVHVHADPSWYIDSAVLPYVTTPPRSQDSRLEALLSGVIRGNKSFFVRREVVDEYGWRNYGEIYADHELAYYRGDMPLISHYNNQYDFLFGALLQYLRSGDTDWFNLADALARHVMDIDIYRTTEDRAAYSGGPFWHTDHYLDAATSTHRAFSRHNCRYRPGSYGGGPSNEHNYTSGLLLYYLLTGNPSARATVLGLADWVIQRDDGGKSPFRFLDKSPTGLASSTAEPVYHGPGRGSGNSVNALLDAWSLSGRNRYLDKAEELIRRVVHPHDDVAARHLLNVEYRWSYTVFLSALARYLHVKSESGAVDEMYAYAQASLLTYARWMLENERPYLDQIGKLQYPTETWAAQEMRKANVLRLAAAHADEALRFKLLQRAGELAERAWNDLLRFESRFFARPVAIMLTEGVRDDYFNQAPLHAAPRAQARDFGVPEPFVPQKQRVYAALHGGRGLPRALARLVNPRTWFAGTRQSES